jgi:hypothetical protein
MPKLYILQGKDAPYDKNIEEQCSNCQGFISVDRSIELYPKLTPEQNRQVCLRIANEYMDQRYNIIVQDKFWTNKDVKPYVLMADVRGYEIEFIRLPNADEISEQLSWKEALAS